VDGETSILLTINRVSHAKGVKAKLWWITFRLEPGYFKKEVALSQYQNGKALLLRRNIYRPGMRLDWLVWARSPEEVSVFVDGMPRKQRPSGFDWDDVVNLNY
jgi:hypothetical protein